jgi:hypothetical protein
MSAPQPPDKPHLTLVQNTDADLEAWLADLQGQAPAPDAQVDLLRSAIARSAQSANAHAMSDAHAWQQLQFRLRQVGLGTAPAQRKWWLMAAGVAGLGLSAALAWHLMAASPAEVELVRAEPPQWKEADAAGAEVNEEPKIAAQRMASALAGKGTVAKVYEFRGKYVVEFKAESERLYEIQRASVDLGLRTQIALGKNRVVFTRKAAPASPSSSAPSSAIKPAQATESPAKSASKP